MILVLAIVVVALVVAALAWGEGIHQRVRDASEGGGRSARKIA